MKQEQRAQDLAGRILDYLLAEGFRDEQVRVRTVVTYDHRVMVSLYPRLFDCVPCSEKGLVAKLAESIKLVFGAQWCPRCREAFKHYSERNEELMPRLKVLLERMFDVQEVTPGHPGSSLIIAS